MANELHAHATSGLTLYAVLLNSVGQVWNGSAFEAYNGANWTSYDIALTEAGAGIYLATMPTVALGAYTYAVYERAGASPATTDTLRGTGSILWDGDSEVLPVAADASGHVSISGTKNTLDALAGSDGDTLKDLSDEIAAISSGSGSGTGSYTDTVTDGVNPLDGVRVQLSTDAAGANRVYETYTDALGVFKLNPDPGVYYVWLDLAGYTFTQGAEVTVV
jgi:hypothetical protein